MGLTCKPCNELRSLFAKLENEKLKAHEASVARAKSKKEKEKSKKNS